MKSKYAMLLVSVALLALVVLNFAVAIASDNMAISSQNTGVVLKNKGDSFTVSITFQNTGSSDDSWTVNVVFEGDWTWKGTAKALTLNANEKKTLVWTGTVPNNVPTSSIARLVVYYDDGYKALDWWIHVVPNSVLSVQASSVT
jgi:hypothetical protein